MKPLYVLYKEVFSSGDPLTYIQKKILNNLKELSKIKKGDWLLYWSDINSQGAYESTLCLNDLEDLRTMSYNKTSNTLYFIINSIGGKINVAESIINYLESEFEDLNTVIPFIATSAAALICVISKRIYMGNYSFLGSISPVIGQGKDRTEVIKLIDSLSDTKKIYPSLLDVDLTIKAIIQELEDSKNEKNTPFNNLTENSPKNDSNQELKDTTNRRNITNNPEEIFIRNLFDSLLKFGLPLWEAVHSLKWVIKIAYKGLKKSHLPNANPEKLYNAIRSLLLPDEIKFHSKIISKSEAKEIGLKIEDLDSKENQKMEELVLEIQDLCRILRDKYEVIKIIGNNRNDIKMYKQIKDVKTINYLNKMMNNNNTTLFNLQSHSMAAVYPHQQIIGYKESKNLHDTTKKIDPLTINKGILKQIWDNEEDEYWNNL